MNIKDFYENEGFHDLSELIVKGQDKFRIDIPEDYGWRCKLMTGVVWQPPKGKAPNWFHRKMQELFFGVKWFNANK